MEKAVNFNDVQALSITLTKMASVTDSPGEKAFPTFLASLLQQLPYFREHPENIQTFAIPNDEKERSNLFALVQGTGTFLCHPDGTLRCSANFHVWLTGTLGFRSRNTFEKILGSFR